MNEEFTGKFSELLLASEGRIDQTNKMIQSLVHICHDITQKYISHIDQLSKCRDQLADQNQKLLHIIDEQRAEIARSNARYTELVHAIVARGTAGTSINVN